jgi:predicted RNase H-like HicB family nuclease
LGLNHYHINLFWSDEDKCFVADIPDLQFCSAFGDTREEALKEVLVAEALSLDVAEENDIPIPETTFRPVSP